MTAGKVEVMGKISKTFQNAALAFEIYLVKGSFIHLYLEGIQYL